MVAKNTNMYQKMQSKSFLSIEKNIKDEKNALL